MRNSWWQSVRALLSGKIHRRLPRTTRPAVESLEDRRLLATRAWDGGGLVNDKWTNRFNWFDNVAPVPGDNLVFPDTVGLLDRGTNNDFPDGTQFNKITLTGENYVLRGNRITLGTGGISDRNPVGQTEKGNKITFDVILSTGQIPFELGDGAFLETTGSISGTGGLVKIGTGRLNVGGNSNNTYTGKTTVVDGLFGLFKKDAIGVPSTFEINGGQVVYAGDIEEVIGEDIADNADVFVFGGEWILFPNETIGSLTITNGQVSGASDNTLAVKRGLALGPNRDLLLQKKLSLGTGPIDVASGSTLTLGRQIIGGALRKTGPGTLVLDPQSSASNTYGATTIVEGTFEIQSVSGRTLIPGNLNVGTGTGTGTATFILDGTNQVVADAAVVSVGPRGLVSVKNGARETIGRLLKVDRLTPQLNGRVTVASASRLTVNEDLTLAGATLDILDENSQVTVLGPASTVRGTFHVDGGALELRSGLTMTAGLVDASAGVGSKVLLTGKVTTNANAAAATIKGVLELSSAPHIFTVADGAAEKDLIVNALIQNAAGALAGIIKTGPGKLELTGNNTYGGSTHINQGVVLVQGVNSAIQDTYFVSGGQIAGRGTISDLRIGSSSDASISPDNGGTAFKVLGTTTFGASSRYIAELNGTAPGQFDRVATQTAVLEHLVGPERRPVLDARVGAGFTPAVGTNFRIVDITGPNPVGADQFFQLLDGNVLTQGETFQINGLNFTISYSGGTGNDIVLTRNTGPAFANRKITPVITEGQTAFITGRITEPNHQDTFFLDVDWGDGVKQTFTFPPGSSKNVKVGHRYLDDPAGADDRYQVKLRWRDQHGGGNSAALETVVRNKAPVLGEITASLPPLNIGEPITIRGTIQDVPRDSFKLHVRWDLNGPWQAINLPAGTKTFQLKHTYAKAGDHHVTILLIDDDLDFDQVSFLLRVQ